MVSTFLKQQNQTQLHRQPAHQPPREPREPRCDCTHHCTTGQLLHLRIQINKAISSSDTVICPTLNSYSVGYHTGPITYE